MGTIFRREKTSAESYYFYCSRIVSPWMYSYRKEFDPCREHLFSFKRIPYEKGRRYFHVRVLLKVNPYNLKMKKKMYNIKSYMYLVFVPDNYLNRSLKRTNFQYRKNSKNWETLNHHRDCPTNGIVAFYSAILRLKDSDRITE